MTREKRIEESSEFKYHEEHFGEMMKEMELDEQTQDFEIPEEWDREFRKIIDDAIEEEDRKLKRKRRKIQRLAAGIVLVGGALTILKPEPVQGEGFLAMLQKTFGLEKKSYVTFGSNGEKQMLDEIENTEILFDAESMDELNEQIQQELHFPMFYIGYNPKGYKVTDARYDSIFEMLNLKLENGNDVIYIVQQRVVGRAVAGEVRDKEAEAVVTNHELKQEIPIFQGEHDGSFVFGIKNEELMLSVSGVVTLEECKKVAESIYYE